VYQLIERLKMKFQQLNQAVTGGDDRLVHLLDRDIAQSLHTLLEAHATSPRELYQQLRFVGELVLTDAGDPQSVRRSMNALLQLLDRSFQRSGLEARRLWAPPGRWVCYPKLDDDAHLYQSMLDAMSDQVALVGRDARIIFANRAFAAAHHRRPLECVGRHFHEFEFGNGLPLDFDSRINACFDEEKARFDNSAPRRLSRAGFEPVELRPLFLDKGPAVGVMVLFRQFALSPLQISC
jgi:PAS domain-containing protein